MSIAEDFLRANPPEEHCPGYSQAFAEQEAIRFKQWFQTEGFKQPTNLSILQEWLNVNDWPITFYNLKVAFFWIRAEGLLAYAPEAEEPEEPKGKYSRPVVQRVEKTEEQMAAEATEIAAIGTIGPGVRRSGKLDVDPNLRAAYQRSLVANRNDGRTKHLSLGEARAYVSGKFPELKLDTPAHNEWVARLMFNQND